MATGSENSIRSFYFGKREGVRAFAWWRDGVQFVGTCGWTLEDALREIDKEEQRDLLELSIEQAESLFA